MERTVYNPQKGRLETIDVEFTASNTTWFDLSEAQGDIAMITDLDGDLLITEQGINYPVKIYGYSRELIHYDRKQAALLQRQFLR